LVWAGFRRLAPSQAQLAIYSEAPEQPPLTGWLKRARGRFLAARWSQRVAFVLAVGGVGCAFFTAIGFPREKIVPFGYYLSAPAAAPPTGTEDGPFRFFSAGQLIRRKGIDLLIQACASLPRDGWRLDIYGDGPERPALERLVAGLRLSDRITFHGTVPSSAIASLVAAADCAVLPSRFDGWGMLVNESLAAGTPVICTSQCGAAVFPAECGVAAVAPAATSSALARAISVALAAGPPPAAIRSRLTAAVRDRGSAPAAAARFLAACPA
jgi:glycosyltransferase involved in cell wall biosynthesis